MKDGSSGIGPILTRTKAALPGENGLHARCSRLAGLAVLAVAAAVGAELVQRQPVGVVATVLLGDVVAVLALLAGQGDLRADVALGHGSAFPNAVNFEVVRVVAEAGLEPATQRL